VAGVLVLGHKNVGTFLVNVVGINTWSVNTQATAASGYLQEGCSSNTGDACAVLPVTFPVSLVTCDKSNNAVRAGDWSTGTLYKLPLCGNSPGNVGWLDWTPPGGGSSELVCSILHPNNPAIVMPSWQYVTSTGNVNGGGGQCGMSVEDAIRTYDGQIVTIPLFDYTCNPGPNGSPDNSNPTDPNAPINTSPNFGCPAGDLGGSGQNQWYRFPAYAHFKLCISSDAACVAFGASYGAYISGNDKAVCDTGNGATSCLVGRFVSILNTGTIGAGVGGGTGNSKAVGVQLIK
jgi:type II secretory pathway pseudopilin PulG